MTKKQNRRYKTRKIRRVLNASQDARKITGHRLHSVRYGDGLNRKHLSKEDVR